MCRTWFCIWELIYVVLSSQGSFGIKIDIFLTQTFHFQKYIQKKNHIVYKMHHRDCFPQQEAAGCISDAISIKVNLVKSVKRICRLCFPNWSFPIPRGSWAVSAVASGWWGLYGGNHQPGTGKGTGTGKTLRASTPFSIVHFILVYILGLMKKSFKECIPGLKKLRLRLLQNSILAEMT